MNDWLPPDEAFLGPEPARCDPATAPVVVLPVPYERTSTYRAGSAAGPAAILDASRQVELYDAELGCEPIEAIGGIATHAPLVLPEGCAGAAMADHVQRCVSDLLDRDRFVVTLGGEHTSVVGAIRAHHCRHPELTVLQIDAHADLRDQYQGDPWSHACAMARVWEFTQRIVPVGVRSLCRQEAQFIAEHAVPVFYAHRLRQQTRQRGGASCVDDILSALTAEVYVTIDCDGLDPTLLPSVGTPEPGGLTWPDINDLLAGLARRHHVVGFDLSELAPIPHLPCSQFAVAKLAYRFLGLIAMAPWGHIFNTWGRIFNL